MVVLLLLLVAVSVTCVSAEDIASDSSGNGDGSGISGEGTFGDSQDGTMPLEIIQQAIQLIIIQII